MSRSFNISAGPLFLRIVLWLLAFVTIIPFLLLLLTSIKSKADVLQGAFALPAYPHFENYVDAWNAGHFNIYFWNSIIVVIPVVAASVFLGLLTGF
ncbi:carbohydrate ABC transporter permease, partial [Rhizobium ruizarguesonis]